MQAHLIAATIDLTDDMQRTVCELVRRFHGGRWPVFRRMHEIRIIGDELVELAEWRDGQLHLRAVSFLGSAPRRGERSGAAMDAVSLGEALAAELR